jgi:hypothetical protein
LAHSFVGEGNIEVLEGELGVDDDVEKAAAVCRGQPYPSAIGTEVGAIDGTGARVLLLLRLVLSTGNIICLAVCVCREICVFLQE